MNQRDTLGLLGRYSDPEQEYSVAWNPLTTLKSPSSIKTDRIISFLLFHFHGQITPTAGYAAAVADPLRNLLQEIRVYGSHAQFGAQTPIRVRAKSTSDMNGIYRIGYAPRDIVFDNGVQVVGPQVLPNPTVAGHHYDVDVFWTLPLFPLPMGLNLAPLYSLKGPDWAGNLMVDCDAGDGTAIGSTSANIAFTAYGAQAGTPQLFVNVIRPLVTVDLMNRISPAITFKSYRLQDAVAQQASFALGKISDLNIGKRMAAIHTASGTLFAAVSPGIRATVAFLDTIITRLVVSLDGKYLALPYSGRVQSEMQSWLGGAPFPVGYRAYSFIRQSGNPDSAFPAETLTAARRFELDGDVTAAAGQGIEVMQTEILGSPSISA